MQPLFDNLNVIKRQFAANSTEVKRLEDMQKSEQLVIEALAFIRGRSLSETYCIIDEAQNLTPHEIKTIITRAGEGTKMVQMCIRDRLYTDWKHLDKELDELITLAGQSKEDEDYIRFQLEQLEEAHLVEGEQEELEQESETLSHAEEIKAGLYRIEQNFTSDEGGLLAALKESSGSLSALQKVYSPATELAERMYLSLIHISS